MRDLVAFVATLFVASLAAPASANPLVDVGPISDGEPDALGLELSSARAYWARGDARPFVAFTGDAGLLYARPQVALGYGKPYWQWFGVETSTIASGSSIGQYGGVRAQLPFLDVRGGARWAHSFEHSLLTPRDHYSRADLDDRSGPAAEYVAFEAEALISFPIPTGTLFSVLSLHRLDGLSGHYVYEESLHIIAAPPIVWRARIGHAWSFGRDDAVRIGIVGEVLGNAARHEHIWRAGIVASVALSPQLDVLGSFVPVIQEDDEIGLSAGDFAQLGLRFRWATGSAP